MFHFEVCLVGLLIGKEFGALLATFEVCLVLLLFCVVLVLLTHNLKTLNYQI